MKKSGITNSKPDPVPPLECPFREVRFEMGRISQIFKLLYYIPAPKTINSKDVTDFCFMFFIHQHLIESFNQIVGLPQKINEKSLCALDTFISFAMKKTQGTLIIN